MSLEMLELEERVTVRDIRMFERYTEGARRTVFFGRYEASRFNSPEIDTSHLLLGILREDKGLIRQVLSAVNYESINEKIASRADMWGSSSVPLSTDLPLSKHGKRALVRAAVEAERLSQEHIGTEHLLLALLSDPEFASAKLLSEVTSLELMRKRVESLPARKPFKTASFVPRAPVEEESLEIHGTRYALDPVASVARRLKQNAFFWERKTWQPRDVVYERNGKRFSFDVTLAQDSERFLLVKGGWKRDHCVVCGWELFESEDPAHGAGFTNGSAWACEECYRRFIETDYFSSAYSDLT